MLDLYAFPKDSERPYTQAIQSIRDPYQKINSLETAIKQDIEHPRFIPYIQLHEFEAFLMVDPDRLIALYPEKGNAISRLKRNIGTNEPERINESPQSAPSKRIIEFIPEYEGQKAQVGPMVAQDIGLVNLRKKCPHFNDWIERIEKVVQ
jgi:hypothetical protein